MSKVAGLIAIHPKERPGQVFNVEVHTEDEDKWGGYSQINPFGGFQNYSKARYTIVNDYRQEVKL